MTNKQRMRPSDFAPYEARHFNGDIVITDVSLVFAGAPDYQKYPFVGGFTNFKDKRICTVYNIENILRMSSIATDINPSSIIDEYGSFPLNSDVVGVFYLSDVLHQNPNFNASKAIIIRKFKGRVAYQKSKHWGFSILLGGHKSYYTIT